LAVARGEVKLFDVIAYCLLVIGLSTNNK